jgi:nitrite reductase/ring-hydroxylating ferredoxin subunit
MEGEMPYHFAVKLEDLPPSKMLKVSIGQSEILIANVNGKIYAVSERCGHMNGPLSMGKLYGTVVECPLHKARYDLVTGKCVVKPHMGGLESVLLATSGVNEAVNKIVTLDLKTYRTKVEQGTIEVEIPD